MAPGRISSVVTTRSPTSFWYRLHATPRQQSSPFRVRYPCPCSNSPDRKSSIHFLAFSFIRTPLVEEKPASVSPKAGWFSERRYQRRNGPPPHGRPPRRVHARRTPPRQ